MAPPRYLDPAYDGISFFSKFSPCYLTSIEVKCDEM